MEADGRVFSKTNKFGESSNSNQSGKSNESSMSNEAAGLTCSLLCQGIQDLNLVITRQQEEQFLKYYQLLVETNNVMNLTTITDFDDVIQKHFLDSLLVARVFDFSLHDQKLKILDLGTGAGFPGIPLKIMFPEHSLLLVDSLNKRVRFLEEVIRDLSLNDIDAVHARAEDLGRVPAYREVFDVCVSRAVANLSVLAEYCLPFVKPGGYFIAYKSGDSDQEIHDARTAIRLLSGSIECIQKYTIPGTDIVRSFVLIKKDRTMSKKYPRKAGLPSKSPLS